MDITQREHPRIRIIKGGDFGVEVSAQSQDFARQLLDTGHRRHSRKLRRRPRNPIHDSNHRRIISKTDQPG